MLQMPFSSSWRYNTNILYRVYRVRQPPSVAVSGVEEEIDPKMASIRAKHEHAQVREVYPATDDSLFCL